jgi:hypothetical protein
MTVLAALVTPAFGATHPTLRLLARSPVKVHGTGFGRDERVTVTYGTWRLRVRTTRFGAFVAQFPFADRCSSGRVVATGGPGQRAMLYIPPTLCPVAQSQRPG